MDMQAWYYLQTLNLDMPWLENLVSKKKATDAVQ